MDLPTLKELARYQAWADEQHWQAVHANPVLSEDRDIRTRMNHMLMATEALQILARGETLDVEAMLNREPADLKAAMAKANSRLEAALEWVDPARIVELPRGPQGPFTAPAGAVLLQAVMHGQHHRGQNASRMRALGVTPPMTDFILWCSLGRP